MNESIDETAILYLLDELDAPARAGFEAKVLADPALAKRLRELEDDFEARIRELPQRPAPAGTWSRIESAIAESGAARVVSFPRLAWAGFGIAAAVLLGVGTLAFRERRHPVSPSTPELLVADLGSRGGSVELSRLPGGQDADERFHELASMARQYWDEPASAAGDRAYALFDPGAHEGFLGVRHLQPPEAGHRYHLWVVDTATNEVHDAGELPVDGAESGLYHFTVTPDQAPAPGRLDFVVTAEKKASAPQAKPAGAVVVASTAAKAY
ncbi:MAG TPA: anti-sigma factor [Candidatus Didemnitutus sp.]|jgi:anti-sigma-K factor RskA